MRTAMIALSVLFAVSRPFFGLRPKAAMTTLDVYSDAAHWLCGMLFLAGIIPNPPGGTRWPYWLALIVIAGVELAVFLVKGGIG